MSAVVCQATLLHDEDAIGAHGRGDTLGDNDLGLALDFFVESGAQFFLCQEVQSGKAVVEDVDG